jgi:hypothetical protein
MPKKVKDIEDFVDDTTFSDFWLDDEIIDQYVPEEAKGRKEATFSLDLIQLSAYRRVISNFVTLLTGKNIPVQIAAEGTLESAMIGGTGATDGKTVWVSSSIRRKQDFDWTVGLSLHEGAHCIKSDWDVVKTIWTRMPQSFVDKAKKKNLSNEQMAYLCKWVFNVVEDRYIDTFVFRTAPGYRGYYKAMYERLWNSKEVSKGIRSKFARKASLFAYEFRIVNFTNPNTDLNALPGLRKMAEKFAIEDIERLTTTRDRLNLAYELAEMIVDNLGKQPKQPDGAMQTIKKVATILDFMQSDGAGKKKGNNPIPGGDKDKTDEKSDTGDEPSDEEGVGEPDEDEKGKKGSGQDESDDADKKDDEGSGKGEGEPKDDIDDILGGSDSPAEKPDPDQKIDPNDMGDTSDFKNNELAKMLKEFEKQKRLLKHDFDKVKETVTQSEKAILDVIEKFGIVLMPAGQGYSTDGQYEKAGVDCIVVQKLTRELIDEGSSVMPMAVFSKALNGEISPVQKYEEAVNKGWTLGKQLGKKLQIRGEVNVTKFIRKRAGRLERRLLHGIGAGLEDIFNRIFVEKYNKARMHISVDASSSMDTDSKWLPTMTCLTAICVAASMVENLKVSVSFRCTHRLSDGVELPYIILAYDSETDKIAKVRQIFPYLKPAGCTPEGLAFEAIMNKFIIGKKTDEQDHYFVNLSDGEPCYLLHTGQNRYGAASFDYQGNAAAEHTRRQVEKMRKQGVRILSYFISSETVSYGRWGYVAGLSGQSQPYNKTLSDQFITMYGKDGKNIDVTNVMQIAKTINALFLAKE